MSSSVSCPICVMVCFSCIGWSCLFIMCFSTCNNCIQMVGLSASSACFVECCSLCGLMGHSTVFAHVRLGFLGCFAAASGSFCLSTLLVLSALVLGNFGFCFY